MWREYALHHHHTTTIHCTRAHPLPEIRSAIVFCFLFAQLTNEPRTGQPPPHTDADGSLGCLACLTGSLAGCRRRWLCVLVAGKCIYAYKLLLSGLDRPTNRQPTTDTTTFNRRILLRGAGLSSAVQSRVESMMIDSERILIWYSTAGALRDVKLYLKLLFTYRCGQHLITSYTSSSPTLFSKQYYNNS